MAQQTPKPADLKPAAKPEAKATEKQVDQAAELRRAQEAARLRAEQIEGAAQREAQRITQAAELEAKKIKKAAEDEARTTRKATEAEARRIELANQAREAEARATEEAAREEAERLAVQAADTARRLEAERLPAPLTFMQEQLEVTTQLTREIWQRNLELAMGMVPAYVEAYEQAFKGLGAFSGPTSFVRESADAGTTMTRELLSI